MAKELTVAVVGATGAVGTKMMEQLAKRKFPVGKLKLLASKRSAGNTLDFAGQTYTIEEATPEAFEGVDVALFSAGGSVSKALAKSFTAVVRKVTAFHSSTRLKSRGKPHEYQSSFWAI